MNDRLLFQTFLRKNPTNIDALALSLVPQQSRVLELGCGDGRLTKYLSRSLHCHVTTVDVSKTNLKNARPFAKKCILGDIQEPSVQSQIKASGPYDIIYATAFINHLSQPEQVIQEMKKWLKVGGSIVVTFANVAHWTMRLQLLFGSFNYTQTGLCDHTIARFYTISSARALVEKCGYRIDYFAIDPYGFVRVEKLLRLVPYATQIIRRLYAFFPNWFAYQIVFLLRPL